MLNQLLVPILVFLTNVIFGIVATLATLSVLYAVTNSIEVGIETRYIREHNKFPDPLTVALEFQNSNPILFRVSRQLLGIAAFVGVFVFTNSLGIIIAGLIIAKLFFAQAG